ncbi:MAG: hypothetical protein ACREKS_08960, partial [Candidatus Rokuibacteriota bacterium]
MDMNDWILGSLVRQRLDEIRTESRWAALAAASRPPRHPLRAMLGLALIRIGRWALGSESRSTGRRSA